jgi:Bacterial Ig-like domain
VKQSIFLPTLTLLLVVLTRCAIVIPPTGGPKDEKAPVLKKSIPAIGTTNFKERTILLEFDEEIEVDPNLNNVIVSPLLEGGLQVREKKKKYLELVIPSVLKENTTYSISINNSIKDVTEGNILKNVTYAFSTGPALDSLTLNGNTINIETKQAVKDVLIGLYEKSDTLKITEQKPLYLTYSDAQGNFNFQYLKKGTYYLIALEDKNKNLLLDNQEKTDFIELIPLTTELKKPLILELSVSDNNGNKLLSKKSNGQKQELTFRNGIKNYRYETLQPKDKLYLFQQKKKSKELIVYAAEFNEDSLTYTLYTTDSLGNNLIDTLKLERPKKEVYKEALVFSPSKKDILPTTKTLVFLTNKPIVEFKEDSILMNGTALATKLSFSRNTDSVLITLTEEQLKADTLKVTFKKGSLKFYDQEELQEINFSFVKADLANYSSLEMKIQTKEPSYIIQLLTEDYTILEEHKNITILNYDYINSGSYRIRAILDKNGNGYWDRANPINNQKAEPILYYNNDKINLKPNWELKDLMFIF